MRAKNAKRIALWAGIAFLLAIPLGVGLGRTPPRPLRLETESLTPGERATLAQSVDEAVYDAAWQLAPFGTISSLLLEELAQVPETRPGRRTVLLMRAALISDNPEGQSAIFSQICGLSPALCEHRELLVEAARTETKLRQVGPGNRLPLILLGEHHHD